MRRERSLSTAGWRLRMALGGAVCGTFVGILLGALVGVGLGVLQETWAYGLDGALFGGGICGGIGALAGLIFGWRDASASLENGMTSEDETTRSSQGAPGDAATASWPQNSTS